MGKISKIIACIGALAFAGAVTTSAIMFNKNKNLKEENAKLTTTIESIGDFSTVSELSAELSAVKNEKQKLLLEIENYKSKIAENESIIAQYESREEDYLEEVQSLREQNVTFSERITSLEERVSVLEAKEVELQNTISNLQNQLQDMNNQVDKLWTIFENYTNYIYSTESGTELPELELTESEAEIVNNKITELTTEKEKVQAQQAQIEEQKQQITQEKQELESEKITLETNKESINKEISEKQESITNNETTINSNNTTINNYIDRVNELLAKQEEGTITEEETEELTTIQEEITNLENTNNSLLADNETLNNEIEKLKDENFVIDSRITELEQRVAILEKDYSELENQTTQLSKEINSLQTQIDKFSSFVGTVTIVPDTTTEPDNPGETEDPTEEVSSFTIISQPFNYENGMTFEQFVNSDYNIVGEGEYKQIPFSINENGEVVMSQQVSETETITFRVYGVSASDTILNQNYWFEFSNVPDFGLVDGKSYGDWISSENNALKVQTYDISYVNLFPEFEEYKNELVLYKNDIGFVLGFYCNATHRFVNIADKIGQSNLDLIVVGTNHYHIAGEPVIENEKFDTEANRISYELVYYCTQCGKEVSREFVGIDSPIDPELCEHTETYLQMIGAYYDENQNLISCDVVYYCNICGTRVSVEHLDFSEKDSASCVHSNLYTETLDENREDGLYTITKVYCLDCGNLVKSDSVLVCDHSAGTYEEEVVADTEDGGQITYIQTICNGCGIVISVVEKISDTTSEETVTSEV